MKVHAPYSIIAVVLVVTSIGVGLLNRPHASTTQAQPLIGQSVAGRHSGEPSQEGSLPGSGAATLEQRAQAGDARAQFRLGERMHECALARELARRGVDSDLAAGCERDAVPAGDWREWQQKAVAARDPIALLHAALESNDEVAFAEAMDLAARSGDPEAHIALGSLLVTVDGADPVDAVAWLLVGCGDCTVDDPRLGLGACVESGECAPGMRLVDWLAASGEPAALAEAQARAASLKALYHQTR